MESLNTQLHMVVNVVNVIINYTVDKWGGMAFL